MESHQGTSKDPSPPPADVYYEMDETSRNLHHRRQSHDEMKEQDKQTCADEKTVPMSSSQPVDGPSSSSTAPVSAIQSNGGPSLAPPAVIKDKIYKSEPQRCPTPDQMSPRPGYLSLKSLWTLFEIIIFNVIILCLVPVILLFSFIFVIIPRVCVALYLQCRYRGKVRLMSGIEAFLAGGQDSYTFIHVVRGTCDINKIRSSFATMASTFSEGGNFKKKIVKRSGYYCWENVSNFDITKHIKFFNSKSQNFPISQEEVIGTLGQHFDTILLTDHPQWEVLLVPNFQYNPGEPKPKGHARGDNYYAIVYRIHSAILDKVSAMALLQNTMADNPTKLAYDPQHLPYNHAHLNSGNVLGIGFTMLFLAPRWWLKGAFRSLKHYFKNHYEYKLFPGKDSQKSLAWTIPMDMKCISDIKERTETSLPAVLLSCVGTSIRSVVLGQNLPLPNEIRTSCRVAILPSFTKVAAKHTVTNLPMEISLDRPLKRLHSAFYMTQKSSLWAGEALANFHVMRMAGFLPACEISIFSKGLYNTNVVIDNLPGPGQTYTIFGGDSIVDIYGWSSLRGSNAGVGMTFTNYCGRLRLNVVGDNSYFRSQQQLVSLASEFQEEMQKLAECCGVRKDELFCSLVL